MFSQAVRAYVIGSAPAAPATATVGALPGLADVELTSLKVTAVQRGDGLLGLLVRGHLDEAEASRTPAVAVGDDRGGLARPHLRKEGLKVRAGRVKRQITDKKLPTHVLAPYP